VSADVALAHARRRVRSVALLVVILASVSSIATGAAFAQAGATTPRVVPIQDLVSLLGPQLARSKPSAHAASLGVVPARTPITGERTTLPLLGTYGPWLLVRLPGRPNGHTGWINERGTTGSVTAWHLVVDLSRRTVIVYHAGRVVRMVKVVVGKTATPTPAGNYFVEESIALGRSAVGAPFALALSARSSVLQEFDGGPGQIALHGLDNVGGVPGTAASHGCVRLDDATMRWLAGRISPGVPVTITG
jgi:lipoprotein-anchoring transpeptidase ErfK/SrfK